MPERWQEIPEFQPERAREWLARSDRPYVTLKAAATLDGRIATASGESRWITGEAARYLAHGLRALHDAVLVGLNTVLKDDPQLTARLPGVTRQPARIVLDSTCRAPFTARIFAEDGAARYVIAGRDAPAGSVAALRERGVAVRVCSTQRPAAAEFLPWLRGQGVNSVLVEGGGAVHGHFVANAQAQELFLFVAGLVLGDERASAWCGAAGITALSQAPRLRLSVPRRVGEDILLHGLFGA